MFSGKLLVGVLGALTLIMSGNALAQEAQPHEEPSGMSIGAGYFMVGPRWLDTGALSERLEAAGYTALGRRFLSIGGGGHGLRGRWLLGGEWLALIGMGEEVRREEFRAEVSGGYGLLRVGYALLQNRLLSVYPTLGIGGGGVSLSIFREQDVTFDDVLANPLREATLFRGGMLLDAGVGAELRIPLGGNERRQSFLLLGVRGGYMFFISFRDDWETPQGSVTGTPDFGLSGPGIQLLIGLGGMNWK